MRRTKFGLSRYQLLTGDMGFLYPINLIEYIPGDTIQMGSNALVRLSPLAAPVMHPVEVRIHHMEVPHRLSWGFLNNDNGKSWEDFITGGSDGQDATPVPSVATSGAAKDLLDYFGIPPVAGLNVSAVPIAAFNLCFNEWYRDQDLVASRTAKQLDVPRIAWGKDYFTTCRASTQKGAEISLPLTGNAPVIDSSNNSSGSVTVQKQIRTGEAPKTDYYGGVAGTETDRMYADLSNVSAATVNEIRQAFALQRYQEVRSRFGSRYTEYLRYLGARPADARLQRPIYLGGGRARVAISEVLQTANEPTQTRFGVGDLYGHGISGAGHRPFRRTFNEHGYIISMLSVRPRSMYQDGIERTWLRKDKEDFWQRELQHIGQQRVLNNEIYAAVSGGEDTFGYQDRYREYREARSHVTGEFRDTLSYWHLARQFQSAPTLNESFIQCDPSKRIYNEQTQDGLWIMVQNRVVARRPVSRSAYGRII